MATIQSRNVPIAEKKEILSGLEKTIKKYGLPKTKAVIIHYFKNYTERSKAQKRIEELKAEIAVLEKKK